MNWAYGAGFGRRTEEHIREAGLELIEAKYVVDDLLKLLVAGFQKNTTRSDDNRWTYGGRILVFPARYVPVHSGNSAMVYSGGVVRQTRPGRRLICL